MVINQRTTEATCLFSKNPKNWNLAGIWYRFQNCLVDFYCTSYVFKSGIVSSFFGMTLPFWTRLLCKRRLSWGSAVKMSVVKLRNFRTQVLPIYFCWSYSRNTTMNQKNRWNGKQEPWNIKIEEIFHYHRMASCDPYKSVLLLVKAHNLIKKQALFLSLIGVQFTSISTFR